MNNEQRRTKRKMSIRKKISGTSARPRVTVYRSNYRIYAQVIDDVNNVTVAAAISTKGVNSANTTKMAESLAGELKKLGVNEVVFDRNGYMYHGNVKLVADTLRKSEIKL